MIIQRNQGSIPFIENSVQSFDLAREDLYKKLQLRLKGLFTVTIANGTALNPNAPLTLIKRVELILNGKTTIVSVSGQELFEENTIDNKQAGELINLADATIQADTAFFAAMDINFLLKTKIPEFITATLLDSRKKENNVSSLELKITFGQASDIVTPDTTTVLAITECTVALVSEEEDNVAIPGLPTALRKRSFKINSNLVEGDNEIELNLGNIYNRILIQVIDNGLLDNALVNNVEIIINGITVIVNAGFNELRNKMVEQYNLKFSDLKDGFLMITFDPDNNMTGLLNSEDMDDFKMRFDINAPTGVSSIRIMTDELIDLLRG